jgi:hypothetical protein
MDSLGDSGLNDPKTALMRQVQQEAAMQNARMLVEVLLLTLQHASPSYMLPETQRTLLRTLRPKTRHLTVQGRGGLLYQLHGEVHERLEHRQQAVRGEDTKGEPESDGCGVEHVGSEWESE